jgi:tRNA-dependent cyclodipeptide synthase
MNKLNLIDSEGLGKKVIRGEKNFNGFFGVGLGNIYYSETNLSLYAKWASENLNHFIFIVADDLERYNIEGFEGIDTKEAVKMAKNKGQIKYSIIKKITEKFSNVEVKKWKEITGNSNYQKILLTITKYYQSDLEFKEDINQSLWANIKYKLDELQKKVDTKEFNNRFRILVNYSLEEISIIIYLTEFLNYQIKIGHKGERVYDNIVDRIYGNNFPRIFKELKLKNRRGNIYLQVEV